MCPPQWKGCSAAGAIDPGLIRGTAPEMGLIKGVGQGKGGASPLQSQPTYQSTILVGECSAFLASGSDPTDERCMKHGPQTSPRRGRRELSACALTERVIASRALTFHRVKHRECAHAFFSCNAYLETLRYVPQTKMLRSLPAAYAYLELRRTLRHTSTPDIYLYTYIYIYIYKSCQLHD